MTKDLSYMSLVYQFFPQSDFSRYIVKEEPSRRLGRKAEKDKNTSSISFRSIMENQVINLERGDFHMHKVQTTTTKVFEVTHTFSFLYYSESRD